MTFTSLLSNIYLFKELSADQLEAVSRICASETLKPSDKVFSQGDRATALYLIKLGSVRIAHRTQSGEEVVVATIGTGSVFGEMAFLNGDKRSASAECLERTEIVRIDYEQLRKVLTETPSIATPFYRALAMFLSGRLRITTDDLGFSRELNLRRFQ